MALMTHRVNGWIPLESPKNAYFLWRSTEPVEVLPVMCYLVVEELVDDENDERLMIGSGLTEVTPAVFIDMEVVPIGVSSDRLASSDCIAVLPEGETLDDEVIERERLKLKAGEERAARRRAERAAQLAR